MSLKFLNLKRCPIPSAVLQNFGGNIVVSSDSDSDCAEGIVEDCPATATLNSRSSLNTCILLLDVIKGGVIH